MKLHVLLQMVFVKNRIFQPEFVSVSISCVDRFGHWLQTQHGYIFTFWSYSSAIYRSSRIRATTYFHLESCLSSFQMEAQFPLTYCFVFVFTKSWENYLAPLCSPANLCKKQLPAAAGNDVGVGGVGVNHNSKVTSRNQNKWDEKRQALCRAERSCRVGGSFSADSLLWPFFQKYWLVQLYYSPQDT